MSVSLLLRTAMLAVSIYGYLQFMTKKIKAELAPGLLFCFFGSVMFFAGIANAPFFNLTVAAWGLCGLGLVLAAVSLADIKGALKRVVTPGTVFFVVLCCVFLVVLKGSIFTYQDNFTHWAAVSRILIAENRFTLPTDTNVWFPSYPLGSTAFVYFICKIIGGNSEWLQMLAQAVLMAGCAVGVFAFAHNIKSCIMSAVAVVVLLCCNIEFTELLVDTLLPVVAVGGISFCLYYKDKLGDKLLYIVPYCAFLMSIKNSGVFFVAVFVIFALVYMQKNKATFARWVVLTASPAVTLLLWQNHVKATFTDGLTTKHSMSIDNFRQVFNGKTAEDVKNITVSFGKEVFSLNNPFVWLVIFAIILVVADRLVFKQKNSFANCCVAAALLSYIAYQAGNLGMYLFTMPLDEAVVLACYERYHKSILIFVAAIICIAVIKQDNSHGTNQLFASALCTVALCLCLQPSPAMYLPQNLPEDFDRVKLMRLVEEYNIPSGAGYVIVLDDDYGLQMSFRHMARFTLNSEDVKARYLSDLKESEHLLNEYEYFIIFHQTDAVMEYVTGLYGQDVPQVINLHSYNK